MNKPVIAGNWKMNMTPEETTGFFATFCSAWSADPSRTVCFFPPALSFEAARQALRDRPDILLGVQNIHWEAAGAFTGEVSARMAAGAGARLVLVGHSERRHVFGETDIETGRKVAAAAAAGLVPVLCVGETLAERRGDALEAVLTRQLQAGLEPSGEALPGPGLVLAYEPVWAIGTGVTATPEDASAAHRLLRRELDARYGRAASDVPILYGGSVNPENAAALLAAPGVDGLLVGGASLKPDAFARIASARPD